MRKCTLSNMEHFSENWPGAQDNGYRYHHDGESSFV